MFVSNSGSCLKPAIHLQLRRQMLSRSGAPCRMELAPSSGSCSWELK